MIKLPLSVFVPSLVAIVSLVGVVTGFALRSSSETPLLGSGSWVDAAGGCVRPDLSQRLVVLGFLRTDEEASRQEAERLVTLRSAYAGTELLVAAVFCESPRTVREFLRSVHAGYPGLAEADADFESYGVRLTPTSFLLDSTGRVRARGLLEIEAELAAELPHIDPAPAEVQPTPAPEPTPASEPAPSQEAAAPSHVPAPPAQATEQPAR